MRLEIIASKKFIKDVKLARKRGLSLDKLDAIVETLANQLPLAIKEALNKSPSEFLTSPMTEDEEGFLREYRSI